MNLLVAVDKNWAIGNNGDLLEHIKGDLINFKNKTTGKVIVVGRETLGTFPGGKPLKNRTNIVISRNSEFHIEGGVIAHSIEEMLQIVKSYKPEDVFVVGGSSIYEQLLPYVNTAFVTKFHNEHIADRYFPNLDQMEEWKHESSSELFKENEIEYSFDIYKRKEQV